MRTLFADRLDYLAACPVCGKPREKMCLTHFPRHTWANRGRIGTSPVRPKGDAK